MTTTWRKSTYSAGNQTCIEIAEAGDTVMLRDSKHPEHGHLTFGRPELAALIAAARAGELDDLG